MTTDSSLLDTEPNPRAARPEAAQRAGAAAGTERGAAATGALSARWAALSERDRTLVGLAAMVLGAFLLYAVAIRPAWQVVSQTPARMAEMDQQLQQMQRLALESKELRSAPRMQPQQSAAALKSATDALGPAGRLAVSGDRATITLNNASGEQIRRWLSDVRSNARVRTLEATLSRGQGGYTGSIVVALPTL
jgi:general secretion pathway protein M